MRSTVALTAFALTSCLDLVTAKKICKPTKSKTSTTAIPTSTPGAIIVRNEVHNGNFATVSTSPNEIPDFDVQGDAEVVVGAGYTGDNSPEKNAASLTATNGGSKRDTQPAAGVAQTLPGLSTDKDYTIRFFYTVASNPVAGACTLESSFGGQIFDTRALDTVVSPSDSDGLQWEPVLAAAPAPESTATISISLDCKPGGSANVYVDEIFVSDDVTPENIGSFILSFDPVSDLGDDGVSATATNSVQPTVVPTTMATASTSGSESNLRPSHSSNSAERLIPTTTTGPLAPTVGVCPNGIAPPGTCYLRSPAPDSASCQRSGQPIPSVYQYDLSTHPKQANIGDCAYICDKRADCKAVAFDAQDKNTPCVFVSKTLNDGGFNTKASTKLLWSDIKCFECYNCITKVSPISKTSRPALNILTTTSKTHSSTTKPHPTTTTAQASILNVLPSTTKPPVSIASAGCPPDPPGPPGISAQGSCTSAKSIVAGSICNKEGTITGKPYQLDLDTFPEQYREEYCAFQCQLDPKCKGFGFDWVQFPYTCLFLTASLTDVGFVKDPDVSPTWFDMGCWSCVNCPAIPIS